MMELKMETDQSRQSSFYGAIRMEIENNVLTLPGRWMLMMFNDDQFDAQPEMSTRMAASFLESAKSGPTLKSKYSALFVSDISNTMRRTPRLYIAVGNSATVMQRVSDDSRGQLCDSYEPYC